MSDFEVWWKAFGQRFRPPILSFNPTLEEMAHYAFDAGRIAGYIERRREEVADTEAQNHGPMLPVRETDLGAAGG